MGVSGWGLSFFKGCLDKVYHDFDFLRGFLLIESEVDFGLIFDFLEGVDQESKKEIEIL